jgi:hypothetical protein
VIDGVGNRLGYAPKFNRSREIYQLARTILKEFQNRTPSLIGRRAVEQLNNWIIWAQSFPKPFFDVFPEWDVW